MCLLPQVWLPRGLWRHAEQWCQIGVIQQLGALQGLGTLGSPQQGQEAGARVTRGSPAEAEVAAGTASRALVTLVPGKWGGARPLGPEGVVNPEVRWHLHPPLSVLGKLQTQLPPPLLLQREDSLTIRKWAGGKGLEGYVWNGTRGFGGQRKG